MKIKQLALATLLSLSTVPYYSYAAVITNSVTSVGPKDSPVNPYICLQDGNAKVAKESCQRL